MKFLPKYPCMDGVDRDEYIAEYMKLEKEQLDVQARLTPLLKQNSELLERMHRLRIDYLGGFGMMAMNEAKEKGVA